MSVDLNAELAALRHLVLNSKDDLARYRAAHSDDCFSTFISVCKSMSTSENSNEVLSCSTLTGSGRVFLMKALDNHIEIETTHHGSKERKGKLLV